MIDSGSGIIALVDNPDEVLQEVYKHFRREAAAKAGRGNAKRFARLRDLALKVYSDECFNKLQGLPSAREKIADVQERRKLRNPLRPEYKVFFQKYQEAVSKQRWNEAERNWLRRLELAEFTESTLYGWWKDFNINLTSVLTNNIDRDADGNLVFDATSPE